MKTNKQIKEWILANCVNEDGDIVLSGLNFNDFDGNVYKNKWKVKGDLHQNHNEVKGCLWQDGNKVKGDLFQDCNKVEADLFQYSNKVKGNLIQTYNTVEGYLSQEGNKVKGETYNDFKHHHKVMKYDQRKGWVKDESVVRQLEDMTKEELIEKIRESGIE